MNNLELSKELAYQLSKEYSNLIIPEDQLQASLHRILISLSHTQHRSANCFTAFSQEDPIEEQT